MNAWKLGLIAWIALTSLLVVGNIGKPRTPTTPLAAVIVLLLNALTVYAVVQA